MSSFFKKLKNISVSPLQQWRQSELGRKQAKREGIIGRLNEKGQAAVDARNKARTDQFNVETNYRGGLIAAQRGGLASTILNLGGAAGDPNKPVASQLVGTEAAGTAPEMETFTKRKMPKKKRDWAGEITPSALGGYSNASAGRGSYNRN
jgi:hypothetical protein